ncbi:hypothetical protein V6N11_016788 [Hibiscus sabdariffa]|uniref:Uncharacterized protein n=1 Tax=Hibiscus sabdariffa TaxID=183260 RepID=A0ABR2TW39_9ROSI
MDKNDFYFNPQATKRIGYWGFHTGRRSNTPPGGQPPKHLPKVHLHLGHAPVFSPFIDVSASPDSRVEPLTAPSSPSVDQPYKTKAANSYTTSHADADYDSDFNKPNSATSD